MKLIKEGKRRFHVVSHHYVLYGNLGNEYSYIHFEDKHGFTFCVDNFPTADIMRLVRGKVSWTQFWAIVEFHYRQQEEEARRWREENSIYSENYM